jgi:hypothetical protein
MCQGVKGTEWSKVGSSLVKCGQVWSSLVKYGQVWSSVVELGQVGSSGAKGDQKVPRGVRLDYVELSMVFWATG